jgi:hypothetical protein
LAAPRAAPTDVLRRVEAGEFASFISQVNGRDLLHHEILSVAQVVIRSPEVARLAALLNPRHRRS